MLLVVAIHVLWGEIELVLIKKTVFGTSSNDERFKGLFGRVVPLLISKLLN